MSWSCVLKEVVKYNGGATCVVAFTNSTSGEVIDRTFPASGLTIDADWLKQQCAVTIQQFDAAYNFANAQTKGSPIDLTGFVWPLPVVPPTQAELDRDVWFAKAARLKNAKTLIDLGVLTGAEPQYIALRDNVKNTLKPEYI